MGKTDATDFFYNLYIGRDSIDIPLIERMLQEGYDVDAKIDSYNTTLLMTAARYSNLEVVNYLIEHGSNVNACDNDGITALMQAVRYCRMQSPETVEALIKAGANVNAKDNEHNSVLLKAVIRGITKNVNAVLDAGANINVRNQNLVTPLMEAARYDFEMTTLLINRGANVNLLGNFRESALYYSVREGNGKTTEVLVKSGIDVNARYADSKNALHYSVANRYYPIETTRPLLSAGIDVNVQDKDGNTPLHITIQQCDSRNRPKLLNMMLAAGADPFIKDKYGKTPIDYCRNKAQREKLQKLDPNLRIVRAADKRNQPDDKSGFIWEY